MSTAEAWPRYRPLRRLSLEGQRSAGDAVGSGSLRVRLGTGAAVGVGAVEFAYEPSFSAGEA